MMIKKYLSCFNRKNILKILSFNPYIIKLYNNFPQIYSKNPKSIKNLKHPSLNFINPKNQMESKLISKVSNNIFIKSFISYYLIKLKSKKSSKTSTNIWVLLLSKCFHIFVFNNIVIIKLPQITKKDFLLFLYRRFKISKKYI